MGPSGTEIIFTKFPSVRYMLGGKSPVIAASLKRGNSWQVEMMSCPSIDFQYVVCEGRKFMSDGLTFVVYLLQYNGNKNAKEMKEKCGVPLWLTQLSSQLLISA